RDRRTRGRLGAHPRSRGAARGKVGGVRRAREGPGVRGRRAHKGAATRSFPRADDPERTRTAYRAVVARPEGMPAKNKTKNKTKNKSNTERPVIVTTEYRGVFFGYATDTDGDQIHLRRARLCVYWSADVRGFMGLASTGPTDGCRVGPP